MADRSDHEVLILIEDHVKGMKEQLEKLNEKIVANQSDISCLQSCNGAMRQQIKNVENRPITDEATNVRLVNLEQRPSAFKAVIGACVFLGLLMTVFKFVS